MIDCVGAYGALRMRMRPRPLGVDGRYLELPAPRNNAPINFRIQLGKVLFITTLNLSAVVHYTIILAQYISP